MTAGVVRAELLNEKWDGKTYYIQARLEINPKEVEQSIDKLRKDRQKTKELEESKIKVTALLQEINELKKKVPSAKVVQSKSISYMKAVDKLRAMELCERAVSQMFILKDEEAIELYSEAIALDPNFIDPYCWRAGKYFSAGVKSYGNKDQALTFYRKAFKDYDKIVHLKPKNYYYAWALSGRGDVYKELGEYGRAIKEYSEAIIHDRENSRHYVGRAKAYDDIVKAAELISNDPVRGAFFDEYLVYDRAVIAYKAKYYKEAIRDHTQLIQYAESKKNDYIRDTFMDHLSKTSNWDESTQLAKEDAKESERHVLFERRNFQ